MPPRQKPGPKAHGRKSAPGPHTKHHKFAFLENFITNHVVLDNQLNTLDWLTSAELYNGYKKWISLMGPTVLEPNIKNAIETEDRIKLELPNKIIFETDYQVLLSK